MAGKPFDATLKDLVECGPSDWPILSGLPRAPTQVIDADIATVSGAADKVLRVESAPPYLLHLEFLSGHDTADQERLLHKRNLLLEDRHNLDVRTVAIILRPRADSPTLSGFRSRVYPGETEAYTTFRYQVIRVWQMPAQTFLAGGLGTLPLAPIAAVTERELPGIIRQIARRLQSSRNRTKAPTVWAATYILMGLRYSAELAAQLMHGVVSMEESTTYQAILRRGLQEGREEGRRMEARRILFLTCEKHFGAPDASSQAALESIQDVDRLEDLIARASSAAGWHDLLEQPPPRRRDGRRRRPS
jgi:predicted transposase YdaD